MSRGEEKRENAGVVMLTWGEQAARLSLVLGPWPGFVNTDTDRRVEGEGVVETAEGLLIPFFLHEIRISVISENWMILEVEERSSGIKNCFLGSRKMMVK